MQAKKRHPVIGIITFFLFFTVLIFHSVGTVDISIKNAVPLVIIPLLTAFSMYNSVTVSTVVGLLVGIFMDGTASGTLCFNAIFFVLAAAFVSVLSENLFNRNIRSALLLSFLVSLSYYLLRWVFFCVIGASAHDNLTYLLRYAFPSIVYTNIFIFPFYFLFKYFNKLINR